VYLFGFYYKNIKTVTKGRERYDVTCGKCLYLLLRGAVPSSMCGNFQVVVLHSKSGVISD